MPVLGEKYNSRAQLTNGQKWTRVRCCTCNFLPRYWYITFLYCPKICWLRLHTRKWISLHLVFIFTCTRWNTTHPHSTAFKTFDVFKFFPYCTCIVQGRVLWRQPIWMAKNAVSTSGHVVQKVRSEMRSSKTQIWNEVFKLGDSKLGNL